MSGPGLTDQQRALGVYAYQCPASALVFHHDDVERILAARGVSSVQADDDLRAAASAEVHRLNGVLSSVWRLADRWQHSPWGDDLRAVLAASPAPTEDREEAHRPGCQEFPTGWLCVAACTTVWHDKPTAVRGVGSDVIERVRALADEWEAFPCGGSEALRQLRAALASSTPEEGDEVG